MLIAIITAISLLGNKRPDLVNEFINPPEEVQDSGSARPAEREEYAAPPDVNPFSVASADAILVAESDHFFTPDLSLIHI